MQKTPKIVSRRELLLGTGAAAMTAATVRAQFRAGAARKFDPQKFVADCREAERAAGPGARDAIHEILARAFSTPRDVLAGVGAPTRGGLQPLYRSSSLTILNIVWSPLMQLLPHEHRMWALIGIYTGREDNIFWQRSNRGLAAVTAQAISTGDVVPLSDDVIHSVNNPIGKLTGAIHIYGGDFFAVHRSEWDPETLAERDWDIRGAVRTFEESNARFGETRRCDT